MYTEDSIEMYEFVYDNMYQMSIDKMTEILNVDKQIVLRLFNNYIKGIPDFDLSLPEYSEILMNRILHKIDIQNDHWFIEDEIISINNKKYSLSRLLYFWHYEVNINGIKLINGCGFRYCVNPNHLKMWDGHPL